MELLKKKLGRGGQYPIIWTVYHTVLAVELAIVIYLLVLLVYK
jgi:hypothetical protein|tara:strand:+ start:365 stop:493 length:129 start_codon:yes stop_codon:yes gene_type:complete